MTLLTHSSSVLMFMQVRESRLQDWMEIEPNARTSDVAGEVLPRKGAWSKISRSNGLSEIIG